MVVYLDCVTLGLVKDINLLLVGEEHLSWREVRKVGWGMSRRGIRTIMPDTSVSPTSTIEPGFCATAAEASPRASKERLEYIAWYSEAKY